LVSGRVTKLEEEAVTEAGELDQGTMGGVPPPADWSRKLLAQSGQERTTLVPESAMAREGMGLTVTVPLTKLTGRGLARVSEISHLTNWLVREAEETPEFVPTRLRLTENGLGEIGPD
jgi:hypothetical protein